MKCSLIYRNFRSAKHEKSSWIRLLPAGFIFNWRTFLFTKDLFLWRRESFYVHLHAVLLHDAWSLILLLSMPMSTWKMISYFAGNLYVVGGGYFATTEVYQLQPTFGFIKQVSNQTISLYQSSSIVVGGTWCSQVVDPKFALQDFLLVYLGLKQSYRLTMKSNLVLRICLCVLMKWYYGKVGQLAT